MSATRRNTLVVDFSVLPVRPSVGIVKQFLDEKLHLDMTSVKNLQLHSTRSCAFIEMCSLDAAERIAAAHHLKHFIVAEKKNFIIPVYMEDNATNVRVHDLPPGIQNEAVSDAMQQYGKVKSVVRELWKKFFPGIPNGVRVVRMELNKHIPSNIRILDQICTITYRSQISPSHQCSCITHPNGAEQKEIISQSSIMHDENQIPTDVAFEKQQNKPSVISSSELIDLPPRNKQVMRRIEHATAVADQQITAAKLTEERREIVNRNEIKKHQPSVNDEGSEDSDSDSGPCPAYDDLVACKIMLNIRTRRQRLGKMSAQEKLQAPLQILNCLAVENGPTLLPVRDYFMQVFQKEQESTHHDEELTTKYSTESAAIKKHIKHLQEGNVEFRNTVCDTCKQPLSWPALFFLCKHSYHQDCIRGYSETERDCPVCNKKNIQLMDTLRAQSESRGQHEAFHNLLDRSPEPFSVVAEYFGRGLFNKLLIVEEATDAQPTEPMMPTSTDTSMRQLAKQTEQIRIGSNVAPAKPQPSYGPGAEARLRQEEGQRSQVRREVEESEMRLRLMEQEQIRQRQQASLQAQQQLRLRDDRSPRRSPYGSPKPPSAFSNYTPQPVKQPSPVPLPGVGKPSAASNPFDEEDDMTGYDSAKNPFAADEPKKLADAGNPFEEYDSNLDPFAD